MSQRFASIAAAFSLGLAPLVYSAQGSSSVWTGAGGTQNWSTASNWLGNTVPSGTADVILGTTSSYSNFIYLDSSPSINSLSVTTNGYYYFNWYSAGTTLTLGAGGLTVGNSTGSFGSNLYMGYSANITLAAPQTWTIATAIQSGPVSYNYPSYADIWGNISGSSANPLTLVVNGTLQLGGNNNFYGTVTLNSGTVYIDSDTALGNATLNINGTSSILNSSWQDRLVPNAVTINGGTTTINTTSYNPYSLNFSGPTTLASSSKTTEIDIGGPGPVIFSGSMGENVTNSGQALVKGGQGILVATGSMGITGGVSVNDGLLIVGATTAVPTSGKIGVYDNGYLGLDLEDTGISATDFLNRLDPASSGIIGFDTASIGPNTSLLASPATINENIDLSGFTGNPRLGSATSAIINGNITPGSSGYQFGGGGGTLQVTSNLADAQNGTPVQLNLFSPYNESQSLVLILSGTNSYSGGTMIQNSLLRFDNSNAVPPSAGGQDITFSDRGYLGLDFTPTSGALESLWSRINTYNANAVVLGFDFLSAPMAISTDTLAGYFPSGAYLGTSTGTAANPTTIAITHGDSSMPSIAFAAVRGGHLTISSLPAESPDSPYSLTIGLPNDYSSTPANDYAYASTGRGLFATAASTVELASANTFSGGTTIQGGIVILDDPGALGSGAIAFTGDATLSTAATGGPFAIPNNITFSQYYSTLTLDTTNSFTLSGSISNGGSGYYDYVTVGLNSGNSVANTLTLAGDNSGFYGEIRVNQGELDVANDNAVINANLGTNGGTTVSFLTSKPQVASLYGYGTVNLLGPDAAPASLTISGGGRNDSYFYGSINGPGAIVVGLPDSSNAANVFLSGANTYSGGTTINNSGTLVAAYGMALGTGPVTVSGGSLDLRDGSVVLNNPLAFTSGTIGGLGTFAPTNGPVTIASNQMVAPGISPSNSNYFVSNNLSTTSVGTLNFGTGLNFASGGTYQWKLGNATGSAGSDWDEITVTGMLTVTSSSAAPFDLAVSPVSSGFATSIPFSNTQDYKWTIACADGGIAQFDPTLFNIASSGFDLGGGEFSLSLSSDSDSLLLNFTPVPEPSTYALMALGLGVVAVGLNSVSRTAFIRLKKGKNWLRKPCGPC